MTAVAELFVTLKGVNGQFIKSMDEAGAASARADGKIAGLVKGVGTMAVGFAAAAVGVGVEAVKMAATFDRQMEQIHTLAGVPQKAIAGLGSSVLALAGQVGFSPDSLAEALYHVESSFASTGITGAGALNILKIAAEGAAIGHANLVDVTNALDAAIASGIPGVQNFQQAMGALNSIVGAGDMQMQDLADAFSTGILAIGKQYGVTLSDVGAALATFGDNNIRGQVAATDLRMAIQDLAKQGKPGVAALDSIGIKAGQLAKDMQTGGLNKALLDLHSHLQQAGITGKQTGDFLIEAFTKKSSAPLAVLMGELDRFQSKYPAINKGAQSFGDAWKSATGTVAQQWNQFKSTLESAMVGLGHTLAPVVAKVFEGFNAVFQWFETHKSAMQTFGQVIRTFVVGALIAAAGWLAGMALEFAPVILGFVAVSMAVGTVAMALVHLYEHNAKFRAFVQQLAKDAQKWFGEVVNWFQQNWPKIQATAEKVIGKIANGVMTAVGFMKKWWADHKAGVESTWNTIWTTAGKILGQIKTGVNTAIGTLKAWWTQHGTDVETIIGHIGDVFNQIIGGIEVAVAGAAPVIIAGFQFIGAGIKLAFDGVMSAISVIVDVMTGHWGKAFHDLGSGISTNLNDVGNAMNSARNFADSFGKGMDAASAAALALAEQSLGLADALNAIPRDVNINLSSSGMPMNAAIGRAHGASGTDSTHATGGSLDRGWNLVGEQGPERVFFDGARAKVYPASQSKQMPQGHSAGSGDIHVHNYGVAADPHTLARMTAAEIGWILRTQA